MTDYLERIWLACCGLACIALGHRRAHVKDSVRPDKRECREIREVAALMVQHWGTAHYCRRCGKPVGGQP